MNEQEKLLFKYLCAIIPYNVKCEVIDRNPRFFVAGKYVYGNEPIKNIGVISNIESTTDGILFGFKDKQCTLSQKWYILPSLYKIDSIKPYLRPLSENDKRRKI